MKRFYILSVLFLCCVSMGFSQRPTDKLDRGLVAVPSGSGSFVSWRIFGEEYYDTEYNLYRNGVKVNQTPLKVSNYTDTGGKAGAKYQVAAVVRGVEQAKSAEVTRLGQQYIQFAVQKLYSRRGTDITDDYNINDISLADVDGDGVSEFILKRNYGPDKQSVNNDSAYNCLECYTLKGERLWWIDLGPNMVSGPDEQYDIVGYDWDGDGRAEVLMRGADNMIIHHPDGTTTEIGNMKVNTRNTVNQTDGNAAYTNYGNEYLLYMEGATAKPYSIGSGSTPLWLAYPLPRGSASDWGDGYGHRSTKHYFGAPFLDGRNAYIFLGRGCYTKHHMKAFSVDPQTHALTLYWEWKGESWPYSGQGYHNFGIADVDWDGRDEICFGSMVIDDNGKGLHTTGLGHGDAQHCSDFDPYRHGQEIFACNEDSPAMNYRDGTTGKIYYRLQSTGDDGRALCGNFSNDYPGAIGHSSQSGTISCVADKVISGGPGGFTNNWRIYWDGDLLEEGLDGASSREGAARVFKANGSAIFTADGTANCNWTKNTPSAAGDILGDWREEIIVRTSDNKYVRVYTTNNKTNYRNYTLWHDHQYRQGMVWESMGYNQPPHASYFLGELEGITVAPPPLTNTGRTIVANGSPIGKEHDGQHVLVCDYADTKVSISEGAQPWVVTFNVPSWVQGTNSTATNGNGKINYTYYTCHVSGSGLSGSTRLVKQGDGRLNLPTADFTHTGATDIWAGTVSFNGRMLQSPLWLNRFATLESEGGQFRSIKMDYDAHLKIGGDEQSKPCTVTTDTLALGFGSRVVFDLDAPNNDFEVISADQLVVNKLMTIETKSWEYGPQYLTPVFEFVAHTSDGEPEPGRYHIGHVAKLEGDLSDIRIEGLSTKVKSDLSMEADGSLYLTVEEMRESTSIVWSGANGSTWDLGNTENFTDGSSANTAFVTGDNAIFNDEAAVFTVNLSGEIEADSVIVDNTKAYTFQGSGALVGSTKLVKRGKGRLVVKNDNSYTGGNRISGGVVEVSSLANANQAKGNLGGMTTAVSKFVIENGGTLQTTAAVTNGSAIRFDGEQGGIIDNKADFISDRAMSGTVMTKKGTGWMKLNVSNASLTKMIVSAGTVQCINANIPAKTVEFQGGTLRENTGTSYTINVPKGKTGSWYMANRSTYTNKITGEGTLNAYCVTEKGTNYYATRTPVQCNLSEFEGTLKPTSSLDDPAVLRFTMNMSGGMPNGTMDIAETVEVQNSGKTFHVGRVTGKGALGGSCTFSNSGGVGANTWEVGNDNTWSTTARITSNANFVKVGAGKVTWGGSNSNTGTTTVREGELAVNSSSCLGTGKLTVDAEATLSGTTNAKNALTNQSVTVNGTLRPGLLASSSVGTIFFSNKAVTISQDGTLQINAQRCVTATLAGSTSIEGVSTLTLNGTLRIVPTAANTLQVGDSIRIFQASKLAGTPTFDFQGGIDWDTSRLSEGLLFVKSIGVKGDVNGDGVVDVADISSIISVMAGSAGDSPASAADVNGDGTVDVADISSVISIMAENARRMRETMSNDLDK